MIFNPSSFQFLGLSGTTKTKAVPQMTSATSLAAAKVRGAQTNRQLHRTPPDLACNPNTSQTSHHRL